MFAWINKISVDGSQLNVCSQVCRQARKYKIDPTGGSHRGYDSFSDKSEAMRFVKHTLQGVTSSLPIYRNFETGGVYSPYQSTYL